MLFCHSAHNVLFVMEQGVAQTAHVFSLKFDVKRIQHELAFILANTADQPVVHVLSTDPRSCYFAIQPLMFFLLWNKGSPRRHTFFPSNLTSNEYIMNSHSSL